MWWRFQRKFTPKLKYFAINFAFSRKCKHALCFNLNHRACDMNQIRWGRQTHTVGTCRILVADGWYENFSCLIRIAISNFLKYICCLLCLCVGNHVHDGGDYISITQPLAGYDAGIAWPLSGPEFGRYLLPDSGNFQLIFISMKGKHFSAKFLLI